MQSYTIDSTDRLEWFFAVRVFEINFYTEDQHKIIDNAPYTSPTFTAYLTNGFSYDIAVNFNTQLSTTSAITYTDSLVPSSTTQMDIDISTSGTEADKGAQTFTISVDDGTDIISTSVTLTFYSWDTTF